MKGPLYLNVFKMYDNMHLEIRIKSLLEGSTETKGYVGRAIAQAVSRRLPTAAARVQTRVWSCGIL
jgi:hypothetical protein